MAQSKQHPKHPAPDNPADKPPRDTHDSPSENPNGEKVDEREIARKVNRERTSKQKS